jgi:phage protein U
MLLLIGALALDIFPFNPTEMDRDSGGDYVEKPVPGRRPPLEFVGEAPETYKVHAKLFPAKLGGLSGLDTLNAMRKSGKAQSVMRGDGKNLGWMVVHRVSEKSGWLDAKGVGQEITVEITLKVDRAPSASSGLLFTASAGMFP